VFQEIPGHQAAALTRNNQQPKLARLCPRLGYLSNRPLKNDLGCRYGVKNRLGGLVCIFQRPANCWRTSGVVWLRAALCN